jgi:hypothetical protein
VAARRLVIVMVVLLGLSTLAAALVPAPEERGDPAAPPERADGRERDPAGGWSGYAPGAGRVIAARLAISNEPQPDVRVRPGDQLQLLVSGPVGDDIEIPAFGLTETMSADAPARFDILIDRPGTFAVRAVEAEPSLVGRIVSTAPCPPRTPAPEDGSKARGCGPRGGSAG